MGAKTATPKPNRRNASPSTCSNNSPAPRALDDLAALFEAQDKMTEAEPLRRRAAAMRARLGPE